MKEYIKINPKAKLKFIKPTRVPSNKNNLIMETKQNVDEINMTQFHGCDL